MSKILIPFIVITASAYAVYRLIKSGTEQPPEERVMVIEDPSGDDLWYIPDFGPEGEP